MKIFALLLCVLGLLAVPACKKGEEAACTTCHHEKVEKHHDCKDRHCSFFGRCTEGEEKDAEHHRYDDEK